MTERQTFWSGLLLQMRKLQPEVDIYTDEALMLQASAFERDEYGHAGNVLKTIKEPGLVEQHRLWLTSPYTAGKFTMVRAWAVSGVVERPHSGVQPLGPSPFCDRLRELRDKQPGAAFYCPESFTGSKDQFAPHREDGHDLVREGALVEVYYCDQNNRRLFCYDLAEPRTPRQQLAHRLWRRPARNYGDRLYGTYNKRQFGLLLDWADEAREHPEEFVVLTFGSTPVWFPKTAYLNNGSVCGRAAITAGGECFYLRETLEETRAILKGRA